MTRKTVVLLDNSESRPMVESACKENGFKFEEFEELVQSQVENMSAQRRTTLWSSFDDILDRIKIEEG